jgi:hypothetical protein
MNDDRPFLLLRARVKEEERDRFAKWFRAVHLHDVERIPGIVAVQSGRLAGGTHIGFYSFESSDTVQGALASPEAAYARGTWERWAPHMEELAIEIWAALGPLGLYHGES